MIWCLRHGHNRSLAAAGARSPILGDLGDGRDGTVNVTVGGKDARRKPHGPILVKCPDPLMDPRGAVEAGAGDDIVLDVEEGAGLIGRQAVDVEDEQSADEQSSEDKE